MNTTHSRVSLVYHILKYTYAIVPIVAGLDKFFNYLVNWSIYVNPAVVQATSLSMQHFMYAVGIIEIVAGLLVLSNWTRFGAYLVALWLCLVAIELGSMHMYYDVAVRDLVMAIGAFCLGLLS